MSKINWKNNLDGVWSNAANWSGGVLPGAADDVYLQTRTYHTITYSSTAGSTTIHSITATNDGLAITGGALTVLAGASLENVNESGGALYLDGPTASISGTFTDTQGYTALGTATTLTLGGTASFGTSNAFQNGATIDYGTLSTTGTTSTAAAPNPYGYYYGYWQLTLGGGADWVNTGTVNDAGYILTGDGAGATAAITNAAHAQFDFTTDDGAILNGSFYNQYGQQVGGSSTFSNAGTLAKTGGTNTSYVDSAFTNTGLIDVATGTIEFDGGGSFGGTITGPGQVAFGGGSATLVASDFTAADLLTDGSGALSITGSFTYGGGVNIVGSSSLSLDGSPVDFTAGFSEYNNSAIYLNGSTLTSNNVYLGDYASLVGPGTLSLSGTSSLGIGNGEQYNISEGATLANSGTFDDNQYLDFNSPDLSGGSIVNSATGTFDVTGDWSIQSYNNYGYGSFSNAGTFAKTGGTNTTYIFVGFTSTGVIDAATGTIEFDGGGTFGGTLTGASQINFGGGTSTLTANALLSVANLGFDGGTLITSAPLAYVGNINLNSGALLLDGGTNTVGGYYSQTGGTLNLGGGSFAAAGGFSSTGGTFALGGGSLSVTNATLAYNGSLLGPGTVTLAGTTTIGYSTGNDYYLSGGVAVTNNGTIDLNQYLYFQDSYGSGSTISNPTGSTFDITGDYSVYAQSYGADTMSNAGTFAKTGGTNTSAIYAAFTNTGVISVSGGTLDFSGGGTFGGTLTGAGTIEFDNGTDTLTTIAVFNAANLDLNGGTLLLEANENFRSAQFTDTGGGLDLNGFNASVLNANLSYYGTLSGSGTLALAGTTTVGNGGGYQFYVQGGATLANSGTLNLNQYIYLSQDGGGGYIVNNAGAIFNVLSDWYIGQGSGPEQFTNAGTFAKTGGTGTTTVGAYFASTGKISSATGTIQFNGGGSFSGTLTGAGEINFYNNSYALGSLSSNVALIDLYGSALAMDGNATLSGQLDTEGTTIYGSTTTLTVSGGFNVDQQGYGTTIEGGTLSTTGSTTVIDWYSQGLMFVVGGGGTWSNSGTAGISGLMQLGDNAGSGTILNKATGVIDLATDDSSINQGQYYDPYGNLQSSSATFVNAGTLAKTGGTATSNVNATLTSTGTLGATTGTLSLDDGGALSGSILAKSNIVLAGGTFADGTLAIGNASHVTNDVAVTQTGTLTIGDATKGASFINAGSFALSAGGAVASGTGAGSSFANSGVLEQLTGTARSVVSVNVGNTGTIYAGSGTLALTGTLTGAGVLQIGGNGTLELGAAASASTETVTFESSSSTLALDAVASVKEKIAGFVIGDTIDLVNTAATSATLNTAGQLVIDNNSTAIGTLLLTGTHTGDVYAVGTDGHGGSKITITSNSTTWKATTNDWYATNQWNNGAPGIASSAVVSGSNAFTLSLASTETATVNTLALSATKATTALAGIVDVAKSVTLSAGTLAMNNDTLVGGTLVLSAGTVLWAGGELDNTILDGTLNLSASGAQAGLEGTSSLTGSTGTGGGVVMLTGASANLYTQGDFTLDNTLIDIGNASNTAILSSYDVDGQGDILQLGANLRLVQTGLYAALQDSGNADDAVFNAGTITAAIAGGTFSTLGNDFENDGTITVSKGDDFDIQSAQFVNTGTLTVNNGTLALGTGYFENDGSITTTNSTIIASSLVTTGELVSLLGGGDQVSITGTLNNAGATLAVGPGSSVPTITLTGTIEGGTVVDATGALALEGGTLSGVTYEGPLNLSATNALVYVEDNSSVTGAGGNGPGTVTISGANADLDFTNSSLFDKATIGIGNATTAYIEIGSNQGGSATLTLGSGVTINHTGQLAQIYYDQASDETISNGTINATLAGGGFSIGQNGTGTFVNQGTINVANGDTLTIDVGTYASAGAMTLDAQSAIDFDSYLTTASLATLQNAGGAVTIGGYLDNTGATLTVGAGTAPGTLFLDGTITGGTIADAGGGISTEGGTLSNLTYDGTLNIANAGERLALIGDSFAGVGGTGLGTINLTGASAYLFTPDSTTLNNAVLNFGSASNGATIYLYGIQTGSDTLTLGGAMQVDQTAASNFDRIDLFSGPGAGTLVNQGTITASASGGEFQVYNAGSQVASLINQGSIAVSNSDYFVASAVTYFTNQGNVTVSGGGEIDLSSVASITNLSASTLTGGTYEADANSLIQLANNTSITTLNTTIILNGPGSTIESLNTSTNTQTTLDSKLSTIGTAGLLNLVNGRGLTGPNLTDNGQLLLGGGKLSATVLTVGSAGTLKGFGTVAGSLTDNGIAEAHNGTLTLQKATGGTGALKIDGGATLEIGVSSVNTQKLAFTGSGGVLQIDAAAGFGTPISGLLGNSIVLPNSVITGDSVSGTLLTVTLSGAGSVTYAVGSGISASKLVISSNGHTLSAYGNAVASNHSPEPVALGAVRVGGTLSEALSIGNAAPTSGPFENLDASIGSASAGVTASGSFTGLAAGATDNTDLTVGLNTGTAGSIAGTAVINLYSDGTGLDTAGKSSIGTQVVNVTGSVYGTAVAQLGTTVLNFGVVHVFDPASLATQTLTVGNGASGALTDFLTGGFGAITGSSAFASDGNSLDVAAGGSGGLGITLATTNSGSFTGTAALALFSHDAYLSDLALSAGPITLEGVVDNYALAALEETSGGGSVTSQTATSTSIDLGQIALGASPVNIALEALNNVQGLADLLGGTLSAAGSSAFSNSGLGSFSGLGAGGADTAPLITLSTSNAGTFTETITLVANGSNASGYVGANQTDTFSITGTIVGPETITLLSSAGTYTGGPANDSFIAANATLIAGDVINGAGGTNTLSLSGGGIFNLSLPTSISNIQILQAQDGQAAYKTIASTYQTVTLAAGLNLAVDVGPGTHNGANPNASGILINGAANADVMTLGSGTDKVAGVGGSETVIAGSGTDLIQAAIGNAGALVTGYSVANTTLEITTGGTATLNASDTQLTVKLDAATNLQLGTLGFITVTGSTGSDVLTAGAVNQTLIGNGGSNTLTGFISGGDIFQDTSAHFSTDTVVNWATGDVLDLTDMSPTGSLSYSGNATSGKLTVSDGTHKATIIFDGNFATHNFGTPTTDGHGGSLIAYHS
jgi:hypothetical protein